MNNKSWFYIQKSRNFYPIDTKFRIQVGLVESKFQFRDGLCELHKSGNTFLKIFTNLIKIVISIRFISYYGYIFSQILSYVGPIEMEILFFRVLYRLQKTYCHKMSEIMRTYSVKLLECYKIDTNNC